MVVSTKVSLAEPLNEECSKCNGRGIFWNGRLDETCSACTPKAVVLPTQETLPKQKKEVSLVHHPPYYGGEDNPLEAIKLIEAKGWGYEFCMASALKYIIRAGDKDPNLEEHMKDLDKAAWYINRAKQNIPTG